MKAGDPKAVHGIPPELLSFAVPIGSVQRWPGNPRVHDLDNLRASLRKYGQPKAIVAQQSSRRVFAGNGLHEAAEAEGWTHIAVTFRDWDDLRSREFLLDDNKAHDRGHDDYDALAHFLADLTSEGGSTVGFDNDELAGFLERVARGDRHVDPDDVPETGDTWVKAGDLFQLGRHRLLCGDSAGDLGALTAGAKLNAIVADPPYGISLDTDFVKPTGRVSGRRYRAIIADDVPFDARPYVALAVTEQFWFGGNYYHRTLDDDDRAGSWLVWDKRDEATDVVAGSGFELIWSKQPHQQLVLRHRWTNFTSHTDAGFKRAHPAQKPVALLGDVMERWTAKRAVILDPFAGVGSTIIAAEPIGRTILAVEIDPRYVQIAIERWRAFTGEEHVQL